MKKLLFFTLLIGFIASGQNCKYKTDAVDEFTNKRILETKLETFTMSGMGLGFSTRYGLKKVDENRFFYLVISSPSIFTLREGEKVIFKTDLGSTITLEFTETLIADHRGDNRIGNSTTPTVWTGRILIPISNENYERLLVEKVIKLRIYTGDGYVDDDISEKRSKKFQELLKCI